jgi:hypothetical protein
MAQQLGHEDAPEDHKCSISLITAYSCRTSKIHEQEFGAGLEALANTPEAPDWECRCNPAQADIERSAKTHIRRAFAG